MYDSSFSFRTQESVKKQAFDVIKSYGMTPAQVFNMFLTQIAKSHTIPLSLDYQPNATTARAIDELMSGKAETFHADNFADFQNHILKIAGE